MALVSIPSNSSEVNLRLALRHSYAYTLKRYIVISQFQFESCSYHSARHMASGLFHIV